MSATTEAEHNTRRSELGDLPGDQELADEKSFEANLHSEQVDGRTAQHDIQESTLFQKEIDVEKAEANGGSTASSLDEEVRIDIAQKGGVTALTEEEKADPNLVFWDGPDDPQNPLNWSGKKKWGQIAVLSILTTLTPLASSMFAPGVPQLLDDFDNHNTELATFVVSVYVIGFAVGPFLIAPLSELYGRLWIYHIGNLGYIAFTVACALSTNMNMLIGFRFMAGCWGVSPLTIGGGTVADIMIPEKRGAAMSIWALGPLFGPVIGPVAGGFLANAKGWRWIFWVIAMATAVTAIVALFVLRETYPVTLLERKTKRLQKETGNMALRSKLDFGLTPKELFKRAIVRPTKLIFLSPICGLMSLYMAVIYGFLYLLFTTFTFVFEENYGFSESLVGLVYVGSGIGTLIGLFALGASSDHIMKRIAAKKGTPIKPEYRLPLLLYAGFTIPVGFFIYGWTAEFKVQWAVPILGTLLIGFGMLAAFMCVNTYLIDAFELYAASAMAANTVLRSIFGGLFPLFGLQMYNTLGLGWGNSLLGFLGLALCPIPWIFYHYGERIRVNTKLKL